ncbi:MAG: Lrp/AsnC family transcriptional regulator [Candidatus Methanofastidiosia archaeon]
MDSKDFAILERLKRNSRESLRSIAKNTGLKPSTVHKRIRKLIKKGIIERFTVKLSDEGVGESLCVFLLVSGSLERYLTSEFLRNPKLKEVYGITGSYDILLKLKFKDIKQFNDFIIDFRERFRDSITKTLTMVSTIKLKEEF